MSTPLVTGVPFEDQELLLPGSLLTPSENASIPALLHTGSSPHLVLRRRGGELRVASVDGKSEYVSDIAEIESGRVSPRPVVHRGWPQK